HRARARAPRALPAQPGTRAQPGAHRAARLGHELRHPHQRDRRLRQLPPAEDRRRLRAEAPAHGARCGLRAEGAGSLNATGGGSSLRARLTLWYTAALGALLAVLGTAAFVLLDRGLWTTVDASLLSVARAIAQSAREPAPLRIDELLGSLVNPALAERFFQLLDPLGRPDPRIAPRAPVPLPLSPGALRNAQAGRETYETLTLPGLGPDPVRLLSYPVIAGGRITNVVQVAMPLAAVEAARTRFLVILLGLAPLALAGVAAGGWFLAGRALAPVD